MTTDRLAREAKLSKTPICKHDADVSVLLEAVMAGEAARISCGLPQEPPGGDSPRLLDA
jgi:hypothetical protein